MLELHVDLGERASGCGPGCAAFLERWRRFWAEHADPSAPPVAIMICDRYVAALRQKSRAMVSQARRRYQLGEFSIVEQAAAVQAVNHSKTETSYGSIYGWTAGPVDPGSLPDAFEGMCDIHQDRWFGGFDADGTLRGYVRLVRMNTLGVVYSIFRHAEHSTGVLNGVLADIAEHAAVEHLSYHTMDVAAHTGRPAFKRHTGFQEARLTFQ